MTEFRIFNRKQLDQIKNFKKKIRILKETNQVLHEETITPSTGSSSTAAAVTTNTFTHDQLTATLECIQFIKKLKIK